MESTGGMGTLCERDRLRMDLMCKEADAQKLSLRTLDSSLHQLAFAYVAAFALCIPAMVASLGHLNEAREMFGVFEFIACTLVFVGAFDALMLVRSRNVCMAHIAFLEDRINEILSDVYGDTAKVLFLYAEDISGFYRGSCNGRLWLVAYLVFFGALLAVLAVVHFAGGFVETNPVWLNAVMAVELTVIAVLYIWYFAVSGSAKVRARINGDYRRWIINLRQSSSDIGPYMASGPTQRE